MSIDFFFLHIIYFLVNFYLFILVLSVLCLVAVISLAPCFLCSHCVVVLVHQFRKFLFLLLFLTRIVGRRCLCDVKPCTWALVSLFSGQFGYTYSSIVHFKLVPKYLTRGIAQGFISFIRFLIFSLVLSSFFVLLKYLFQFFLLS